MEGPCPPSPACSWDSNQLDDDALQELETELYSQLHYSHAECFSKDPDEPEPAPKETQQVIAVRNCLISTIGKDKGKQLLKKREFISSTPAKTETVVASSKNSPAEEVEDSRYSAIAKNLTKPKLVVLETPSSSLESSDSEDSIVFLGNGNSPIKGKALASLGLSDSDLDSVSDESLIDCSDMQLNVSSSTIRFSKASILGNQQPLGEREYSQYICRKWTKAMVDYYEQDGTDVNIEEVENSFPSNARWPVINEDLWGNSSGSRSMRYFNKKRLRCSNCNQMDHLARHCPDPVRPIRCHMCGETGHKEPRCPKKICLGCGAFNGIYSESCRSCQSFSSTACSICSQKGHRNDLCPDLWRRYHLTITGLTPKRPAANSVFMKPASELFCCNCAQRGHLTVHCTSLKTSRYGAVTPVVYDYTSSFQYCERFVNGETSSKPDNYLAVESHNNRFLGEKSIKYSFNATDKITDHRVKELACLLEANVADVDVHWRRQKKKNRVFVEFKGRGNVKEARDLFKKHLHRSGNVKHNVAADLSKAAFIMDYTSRDGVKTQKVLKMKLDSKVKSEVKHALNLIQKWFGLCVQASFQDNRCKITFENAKHSQDAFRRLESMLKEIKKKYE